MPDRLTHVSLFSGIGGLDLAAEAAGFETVCQCEWADYPYSILQKHWPDVPKFRDITTFTKEAFFEKTGLETVTILSGGFPCQPFSVAGKRKGTGDDRYLWPEMLGAIREIRPRWVVGENVLGIVDWSEGLVFEQVCSDMENEGYEVQPFVLPACGVNAPHRRYRVFIVAHRSDAGSENMCGGEDGLHACVATSDPDIDKFWGRFPSKSPVCGRDDGVSAGLDGITFPAWRVESIKAYGNAIVPQVALRIFETINDYERQCE